MKIERKPPTTRVVKSHEIPPQPQAHLKPYFWNSVVRHLKLLGDDEALEIRFQSPSSTPRVISHVRMAAARAGLKVSAVIRGTSIYVSIAGTRKPAHRVTSREGITCLVCGYAIKRPRSGGSKQEVCAGKSGRKSRCQTIRDYARRNHISIEEAKARLLDATCEVCGARIERVVGRQRVCLSEPGQKRSECQLAKHLARVSGISIDEAKRRRAAHQRRMEEIRRRRGATPG